MVPSEMEDGRCLLDVIGDPNLLNEFLDAEGEAGTISRAQALAAAAQAQAEAQVQASHQVSTDAFTIQPHMTSTAPLQSSGVGVGGFLAPPSQPTTVTQQIATAQGGLINQAMLQQHRQHSQLQSSDSVHFIPSQTVHHQPQPATSSQRNGSPLVSVNPNVMVNQISTSQLQYIPGRRSASPAGQQYVTSGSPLVSRTLTPSQSPVPIQTNVGSPLFAHTMTSNPTSGNTVKVSRSVTPSQQSLSRPVSVSPASSMNTFQMPSSMHPSVQVGNAMQVQGMIQTTHAPAPQQGHFTNSTGQQFVQQKTVIQSQQQHPSIQTQQVLQSQPTQNVLQIPNQSLLQAIQQNPGLLQNVNFTTAVSTAQPVKPTQPVNVYSSVQNSVGLQGTIIQTAQGKSILIPNQQLPGQPITVAGLQNLQNLQPIAVRPQQANASGVTTLHTGQGADTNAVGQPQISVFNINPQGQQIVIQRSQGPGQPQNIILRTIPSNYIQLQTASAGVQNSQIPTSQTTQPLSQISQSASMISNPQTQTTSIPIQSFLNSSQGQQINVLNQSGQFQLGTTPGTMTFNIGNQNVNLKQVPAGTFQPTQLHANPHHLQTTQPSQQQQIQLQLTQSHLTQSHQQTNILKSFQPQHTTSAPLPVISPQYPVKSSSGTVQTAAPVVTPSSKSRSKSKKAQAAANKAQQSATTSQNVQLIQPASQGLILQNQQTVAGTLQPPQSHHVMNQALNKDSRFTITPQHVVNVVQNFQLPQSTIASSASSVNYSIASSASSVNYSTANSTPVTTTVSHSMGHMISHVSVANSSHSAPVTTAAVQIRPHMHTISSTLVPQQKTQPTQVHVVSQSPAPSLPNPNSQVQVNAVGSSQPQVQVQAIQLSQQDQETLQKVQHELKPLLALKQLTPEENLRAQKLVLLQRRIVAKGRQQHALLGAQQQLVRAANPQVGQLPITISQPNTSSSLGQISTGNVNNMIHPINPTGMATVNMVNQPNTVVQQHNVGIPQVTSTTSAHPGVGQIKPNQQVITMSNHLAHVIGGPTHTVVKVENSAVNENTLSMTGHNGTLQTPPGCVVTKQVLVPAVPANAPPGKLPISATPAVPTQLKIGNHLVTLSLTQPQKEKLQAQLAKMTPEQQQQFYRHQYSIIQRLQQQHQIQQQLQAAQMRMQQNQVKTGMDGKILVAIQQSDKSIKTSDSHQSPGRAIKRMAITTEIPKGSMLHQQLSRDQGKATNPDMKTCFKSHKDAVQRLLRYHVFQSPGPSLDQFNRIDGLFDRVSEELLRKRDQMFAKYKLLLLDESMRDKSTAEMVMIERLLNQDLTDVLDEEKKQVDDDPDSFEPMPSKYLKMSPVETKSESAEVSEAQRELVTSQELDIKIETEDSEEAVDVEHASSPEKDFDPSCGDRSKSPVRSVSSNGGFKLVIRKNHALNFTSPRADEAAEGKVTDRSALVVKSEPEEENKQCYRKHDKSVLESGPVKASLDSSIFPHVKSELQFTETEEEEEKVPATPFKTFSVDQNPPDVNLILYDRGAGSSQIARNRFSVLPDDVFPKSEITVEEEEEGKKEFTLGNNSGIEDISGDNDTLPDMEGTDDHNHADVKDTEAGQPQSSSETDTALEGLLNYSSMDTMDHGIHGYQFDPDDFQPMDTHTDSTDDHFDISDPFEENGDFFGYGSHYSEQSRNQHSVVNNNTHAASPDENHLQTAGVQVNGNSAPHDNGHAVDQGDVQSTYGLMGQYEAISPVSDRSGGGFNDDLLMQGDHTSVMDGQSSGHQPFTPYYTGAVHATSSNHHQSHALFMAGMGNSVDSSRPSSEVESAVDSIMDFSGSGDRSYSPVVVGERENRTDRHSSPHISASGMLEQEIKSHSDKAAGRVNHGNHVPSSSLGDYKLNRGEESRNPHATLAYQNDDDCGTEHNTNPIFKEQMESAINSILSPASSEGQRGDPFPLDSYTYGQYDNYSHQDVDLLEHTATEDSAEESQDQSGIEDDLETAVNSILM